MNLNDWLTIDKTSGEGNSIISLTSLPLEGTEGRSVSLTIKSGKNSVILNVFQKYEIYHLSETLISSEWEGGVRMFTLETNFDDITFEAPSWVDVYYYRNSGSKYINYVLTFEKNTSSARFGEITLKRNGDVVGTVVVVQGTEYHENKIIYCLSTDTITPNNNEGVEMYNENITSNGMKLTYIYYNNVLRSVPNSLFSDDETLNAVSVPPTVTKVGNNAFYGCYDMVSFDDYNNITEVGDYAFADTSLKEFVFTTNLEVVGDYAFKGCKYKTLTLPSTVASIGDYAFADCERLMKVEMYENGLVMGDNVFSGCGSLKSLVVLEGNGTKPSITANTFKDIAEGGLLEYPWNNNDYDDWLSDEAYYLGYYNWDDLSEEPDEPIEPDEPSITIPNNEIHYTSTDGNVVVPYIHETYGFGANIVSNTYDNGKGIIVFDGDVTDVGYKAFSGCTSLEEIIIPNSVTYIRSAAFRGCPSLTSITIPSSVTEISTQVFYGCSSLTSITIPSGITYIGSSLFYNCSSLTSITIPNGVTEIDGYAFKGCSSLTSINIGKGVTEIGKWVFYDCTSLTSITCEATFMPSINTDTFEHIKENGTLYYPEGSNYSTWLSDDMYYLGYYGWNSSTIEVPIEPIEPSVNIPYNEIHYTSIYDTIVEPEDNIFSSDFSVNIVSNTYENGKGVITFDRDINYIPFLAFSHEKELKTITLPNSVTVIGEQAFVDCKRLETVTIPNSVTVIGKSAFSYCSSLKSINIPISVTEIGEDAFSNCSSLESIELPKSITSIGNGVFKLCESLSSITCEATIAPSVEYDTFLDIRYDGTLYYPQGSDYSTWLDALSTYFWVGVPI